MSGRKSGLLCYLTLMREFASAGFCDYEDNIDGQCVHITSELIQDTYFNFLAVRNADPSVIRTALHEDLNKCQRIPPLVEVYYPMVIEPDIDLLRPDYEFNLRYLFCYRELMGVCDYPVDQTLSYKIMQERPDVQLWLAVQTDFHGFMQEEVTRMTELFYQWVNAADTVQLVVVFSGNTPVNASLMMLSGKDCYMGWSVTSRDYRGRGYASASINFRLQRACELGCHSIVALANPASFSLLTRASLLPVATIVSYKRCP